MIISEYKNTENIDCVFIQHEDGRQESMLKSVYDEQVAKSVIGLE